MYGWEFPPHISGGLGVACYDLTKALTALGAQLNFVLPRLKSPANADLHLKLISSSDVVLEEKDYHYSFENYLNSINFIHIDSPLRPYVTDSLYKDFIKYYKEKINLHEGQTKYQLYFSGDYGPNLIAEVFRYAYVASKIAKEVEHDLIHVHDWMTVLAGIESKRISNKPLVYHVHALETDRCGIHINKEIYDIEKLGLEIADQVVAVSEFTKNNIVNYYHINPNKIDVVHNAVSKHKITNKTNNLIKKFAGEKIILFLGRITYQKGPDYFLEAAAKLLKIDKNLRFFISGYGDMINKLIERTAQLKIARNVHFTGFLNREQVEEVYLASDVYVMPSVSEPFGISPLEAVLYDVPVIISKQSGVAEVLKSSLKVDFWDSDELANKIHALTHYPALQQELTKRASAELKTIQWENSAKKLMQVYSKWL